MTIRRTAVDSPRSRHAWAPWFVLIVSLLGATLTAALTRHSINQSDLVRFDREVEETINSIDARLEAYIAVLRATAGLFAASEEVTYEEFSAFAARLRLDKVYPGIQGLGFTIRYTSDVAESLVRTMRREAELRDFRLWPVHDADERHAIIYLQPLDERNARAIGYDMYSQPVRREAMRRARDSGEPAASGAVELVQEFENTPKQAGFLIYVPVYEHGTVPTTVDERREKLIGFAYAPFRSDDLLNRIFAVAEELAVHFRVYDGPYAVPMQLMHDSSRAVPADHQPRFTSVRELDVAGRLWTITVATRPGHELEVTRREWLYVLIAGGCMSFLLAGATFLEVRARAEAEQNAERIRQSGEDLRVSEERFRRIFDQAAIGIVQVDPGGRILDANSKFCDMIGYSVEELRERDQRSLAHPEDWEVERRDLTHLIAGAMDSYSRERRYRRSDGKDVWAHISVSAVRRPDGRARSLIIVVEDISERRRSQEYQGLLIQELNHRVKNTLALVLSIASQTMEHSDSLEMFASSFDGRIRAMARAHSLLTRRKWQRTSLYELIHTALEPYERDTEDHIILEGPELTLEPEQALSLSTILHELATNAAKYGALSVPEGHVRMEWQIDPESRDPTLHFVWREIGGPPVVEPRTKGFGAHLIRRSVAYELAGAAEMRFEATGLVCELSMVWERVRREAIFSPSARISSDDDR